MFDKTIKKAIKVFVALAMIVASGTALQKNVSAEGNNTAKNLYVQSNTIEGDDNTVTRPSFIEDSNQDEGSEKEDQDSNEGMVWTDKLVEKVDENGTYRITLYAQGFKYRNVNQDNKREEKWLNPLKEDTTLSVTENIPDEFKYVENSIKVNKDTLIGLDANEVYDVTNTRNIKLSFAANDVFCSEDMGNGIAFNVEVSFEVKLNTNVVAGTTYKTGKADSRFVPAIENYYYYTWGLTSSTAYMDGINWNNSGTGIRYVNFTGDWVLIDSRGTEFKITGVNHNNNFFKNHDGTRKLKDKNGIERTYEYRSLAQYNKGYITNDNVEDVIFYVSRDGNLAYFKFEIICNFDGSQETIILEPIYDLGNPGKNEMDKDFQLGILINKESPDIREDFIFEEDAKKNKVIVDKFENHGKIIFAEITAYNLVQDKTASLINWDERTYKIDLFAGHNITVNNTPNIVMMLDFTGSMPWLVKTPDECTSLDNINDSDEYEVTVENVDKSESDDNKYLKIKTVGGNTLSSNLLDAWDYKYYVPRESESKGVDEYKPIVYFNGGKCTINHVDVQIPEGWYEVSSQSTGEQYLKITVKQPEKDADYVVTNQVKDKNIYVKGEDDLTKIEALFQSLNNFIINLKAISPNSQICLVPFAGGIITNDDELISKETFNGSSDVYHQVISMNDVVIGDNGYVNVLNNLMNLKLHGTTRQDIAMNYTTNLIKHSPSLASSKTNLYGILFSDGAISSYDDNTDKAKDSATNLKAVVNKLFTAGIFTTKDPQKNNGVADMISWASGTTDDEKKNFVYIENTTSDLIEAFNDIFGVITTQIGVTVRDYIDNRFEITDSNGEVINLGNISNGIDYQGGKIKQDSHGVYVEWTNVKLSYVADLKYGWHKTIYVKAKGEYIGGNNVYTNIDKISGITVDGTDIYKDFDDPTVNVKVDFVVGNADETVFLGEAPLENAQDKLFGPIKNSKGTELTIAPDGTPLEKNDFEFKWYKAVDVNKLNVINNTNIADPSIERPTANTVYYLQVKLNVEVATKESLDNTNNYDNNNLDTIYATNDMNGKNKVGEGFDSAGNVIGDYADNKSKYGVYIVDVVSGSIKIYKTISSNSINESHGDPIFTFHIKGTSDSGKYVDEYRSVRFTKVDGNNKFVAIIDGLEKGDYIVTELDTIRYELDNLTDDNINQNIEYSAPFTISSDSKSVTCQIGTAKDENTKYTDCRNVSINFSNTKNNNSDLSDTDIVINTFKKNKDGSITIEPKHNHFETEPTGN